MRVLNAALRMARSIGGSVGPSILMYHRISSARVDPWGLSVSPKNFGSQLDVLSRRATVLPIPDFVTRLCHGEISRDCVAITFDDGYADNFTHAAPLLKSFRIPATIFVTVGTLGRRTPAWWDELVDLVWNAGAVEGEVVIRGERYRLKLAGECQQESRHWRAWQRAQTPHQEIYNGLWGALRSAGIQEQQAALAEIRLLCQSSPDNADGSLPLSVEQMRDLISQGIEIGSHGLTHCDLTQQPSSVKRVEIEDSKLRCEQLVGQPTLGFAYPHGECDPECKQLAAAAGYEFACGTGGKKVRIDSFDRFALPRIGVPDVPGESLMRVLRGCRD